MRRRLAALVAAPWIASGCVAFRENRVTSPTLWPPAATQSSKSLSVAVTETEPEVDGEDLRLPVRSREELQEEAERAYADSRLFSAVRGPDEEADLRAEVEISVESEAFPRNGALMLGLMLTGTVIPTRTTNAIHMRTTFKTFEGQTLGKVEGSETVTKWVELFLVFAMPFQKPAAKVEASAYRDLCRSAIAEAHARGVF